MQLETVRDDVRFVYGEPVSFEQEAESPGEKCEEWLLTYLESTGRVSRVMCARRRRGWVCMGRWRCAKLLSRAIQDTGQFPESEESVAAGGGWGRRCGRYGRSGRGGRE